VSLDSFFGEGGEMKKIIVLAMILVMMLVSILALASAEKLNL
jgi:hypothetical protein